MERVERFETLAPLLSAQLRRGVVTNNFLSRADYDREMEAGLLAHAFPGGLLLFRRRTGYFVLNFYLQADAAPELPAVDCPVVTELVWRPKDAQTLEGAARLLERQGFSEQLRRRRYQRADGVCQALSGAFFAGPAHAEDIMRLMERSFDRYTGCVPTAKTLAAALCNGEVVCTADEWGISGLLHFARGRAATEIRHLAVREDCRGCGLAQRMLGGYLCETAGQKSQVWARAGNVPAERFYEKNQYRPDGWESVVLLAGGKDHV